MDEKELLIRRIVLGVKIVLDQEEFFGTLDYCGKNIFKDLKADVERFEEIVNHEGHED